jgi:hypothetical protein
LALIIHFPDADRCDAIRNPRVSDVPQSPGDTYTRRYGIREYTRSLLDVVTLLFLVRFTKKPLRFFGLAIGLLGELIIFPHAKNIKEYQVAEVIEQQPHTTHTGTESTTAVTG